MLRINRQTDYAVRVLLYLARHPERTRLSSSRIQREMLVPQAFMGRIVAQLASAGLVATFPGRDGGLQLSRPSDQISVRDVVEAFEGPMCISDCLDGGDVDCPFETGCPVRKRWGKLQLEMLREMQQVTFAELAAEGAPQPVFTEAVGG